MTDITIWHNPRCSKSRATLKLLEERGLAPLVRRYLDDAPSEDEIRAALAALGLTAGDLVRRKEADFKTAGLNGDSSDDEIIAAMARWPRLIERPVVFVAGQARIGRPPENVLDLF